MYSYTASKFDDIITCFELEQTLAYYKLFNNSEYRNAYHGYMHVRNMMNSIHDFCKSYPLAFLLERNLLIAAIFHDFNYVGVDKTDANYDQKNIDAAVAGWNRYVENVEFKYKKYHDPFVRKLILTTRYPNPHVIDVSEELYAIYGYEHKWTKDISEFITQVINDCDHSMPLYRNYLFLVWQFLTCECNSKTYKEYVDNCGTYLENLTFHLDYFQDRWNPIKDSVIEKVKEMLYIAEHRSYGKSGGIGVKWQHGGPSTGCDHKAGDLEDIYDTGRIYWL